MFEKVISPSALFAAWDEFKKGKQQRKDVLRFEYELEQNILGLHRELKMEAYRHGSYTSFYITDPKQRHIHKAPVRDRILHHAIFAVLNPIFEKTFIYDSYSCRKGKGTHKGVDRLKNILRKVSRNDTKPCHVLKCDIKKFFQSVDHAILFSIIQKKIRDEKILALLWEIIESFNPGVPIGNLTSQLFANIYLNELDQFIKHILRAPFYIRCTDDFILVDTSRQNLEAYLREIKAFLKERLCLSLHPQKIIFQKYLQGIDFLGYVQFHDYRILRTKTKRRIQRKVSKGISEQSLQSYLGVLSHANSYTFAENIKNEFWLGS